jgi:hypothetical protein
MTYASPAWEFAADTHLMKLQRSNSPLAGLLLQEFSWKESLVMGLKEPDTKTN